MDGLGHAGTDGSEVAQRPDTCDCQLELPNAGLRVCSAKTAHCALCARSKAHRGEHHGVVQSAIAIKVDRQNVGVPMALERITVRIASDDLRAWLTLETQLGDQSAME
jgi:hypothetical protein